MTNNYVNQKKTCFVKNIQKQVFLIVHKLQYEMQFMQKKCRLCNFSIKRELYDRL